MIISKERLKKLLYEKFDEAIQNHPKIKKKMF